MMTGIAVDTIVWSKAANKKTIKTALSVTLRSASVKLAVDKGPISRQEISDNVSEETTIHVCNQRQFFLSQTSPTLPSMDKWIETARKHIEQGEALIQMSEEFIASSVAALLRDWQNPSVML